MVECKTLGIAYELIANPITNAKPEFTIFHLMILSNIFFCSLSFQGPHNPMFLAYFIVLLWITASVHPNRSNRGHYISDIWLNALEDNSCQLIVNGIV